MIILIPLPPVLSSHNMCSFRQGGQFCVSLVFPYYKVKNVKLMPNNRKFHAGRQNNRERRSRATLCYVWASAKLLFFLPFSKPQGVCFGGFLLPQSSCKMISNLTIFSLQFLSIYRGAWLPPPQPPMN